MAVNDKGASGPEAPEELHSERNDEVERASLAPTVGKPAPRALPPQPPHTQVNLGIALQQTSLESLPHDIQQKLIESVDQADDRAYKYAESTLQHQNNAHEREVRDRAAGRGQIVWSGGLLAAAILIAGSVVTYLLINAQQYQMAQTVMVAGLSAIGGFLGGLGAGEAVRRFTGGTPT